MAHSLRGMFALALLVPLAGGCASVGGNPFVHSQSVRIATNPAGAKTQVMGVFHPDLVGIQVRVLQRLGSRHVMVVYGLDGLDEISISGETLIGELVQGELNEYAYHPSHVGLELYDRRAIQVTTVEEPQYAGSNGALKIALDIVKRGETMVSATVGDMKSEVQVRVR